MITVKKKDDTVEMKGISTDTKPKDKIYGLDVTNGSTFLEMDTGNFFMFSYETKTWHKM